MSAQVDSLRRFVGARARSDWNPGDLPVIVVAGAVGGAGTSTAAAMLALASAQSGRRTLLVDTDESVGSLHRMLGVHAPIGLAALLNSITRVEDVLVEIAAGCQLIPGGNPPDARQIPFDPGARRTVIRRIANSYADYEAVILDAGSRLDGILAAGEAGVQRFLVVTGVTPIAIASAYAVIKTAESRWPAITIDVLFNRHPEDAARTAFDQVLQGARHFLARSVRFAGALPDDAALRDAPDLPLHRCDTATRLAVQQLAESLLDRPFSAPRT